MVPKWRLLPPRVAAPIFPHPHSPKVGAAFDLHRTPFFDGLDEGSLTLIDTTRTGKLGTFFRAKSFLAPMPGLVGFSRPANDRCNTRLQFKLRSGRTAPRSFDSW